MDKKITAGKNNKPKGRKKQSEESLLSIANSLTEIAGKYIPANEKDSPTKKRFEVPVWVGIISLVINGVLALYTALLYNQAVNQSQSAETAANAAKESVSLFEQNSRIENRPYVGVKEIVIVDSNVTWIGIQPKFIVIYQNYGKTPAINTRITSQAYAFSTREYKIENFGFDTTDTKYSSVLPPGEKASTDVVYPFVMNEIKIANIFSERFFVYVYGLIIYSDVFGGKDSTSFSYIMNIDPVTHIGTFSSSPYNNWMK